MKDQSHSYSFCFSKQKHNVERKHVACVPRNRFQVAVHNFAISKIYLKTHEQNYF
jgi:hypothetical protein